MAENEIRNYKVLVDLANDSVISQVMSAYIGLYNHTRSQARDLTHRKIVGLCIVQVVMEKTDFVPDGQVLDCLLLQIRPVTEKRHSTGAVHKVRHARGERGSEKV